MPVARGGGGACCQGWEAPSVPFRPGPSRRRGRPWGALAAARQPQQAEAIASSITDPVREAEALAQVAGALAVAGTGQHQQAAAFFAGQAEAVARSITDPGQRAEAMAQVAGALAVAGRHQQAEAVARSITDPVRQADALVQVAWALAKAGDIPTSRRVIAATCVVGR